MSTDCIADSATLSHLRVAYLTNTLGPHTLPLCECLTELLPSFRVFLSAEEDDFHGFPREWGRVKVTVLRSFNQLRVHRRAYGFWQTGELHIPYDTYRQLDLFHPDVILANQLGIRTFLATLYALRHPGVKIILCATLSDHSEKRRSWPRRLLRKWLVKHFDGAFINGKGSETYLRQLGFVGPTFTVPYTIRAARFETAQPYDPNPPHFRILYAGMLIPQKGLLPFTRVLTQWCEDHPAIRVDFALVGDGNEEAKLRALALPSNLALELLPRMSQEELARQYWSTDLFAFPTLGDEWGVVVNEAMIAGRPVLGSIYSQAVTEIVTPGVNGWYFDPSQAPSMYSALDEAFSRTADELRLMSSNAKEAVRNLTPERMARVAVDAICDLAGK